VATVCSCYLATTENVRAGVLSPECCIARRVRDVQGAKQSGRHVVAAGPSVSEARSSPARRATPNAVSRVVSLFQINLRTPRR